MLMFGNFPRMLNSKERSVLLVVQNQAAEWSSLSHGGWRVMSSAAAEDLGDPSFLQLSHQAKNINMDVTAC